MTEPIWPDRECRRPTGLFHEPGDAALSAVIFPDEQRDGHVALWVYVNPQAARPLPDHAFPRQTERRAFGAAPPASS
jgi:hypothetical protein